MTFGRKHTKPALRITRNPSRANCWISFETAHEDRTGNNKEETKKKLKKGRRKEGRASQAWQIRAKWRASTLTSTKAIHGLDVKTNSSICLTRTSWCEFVGVILIPVRRSATVLLNQPSSCTSIGTTNIAAANVTPVNWWVNVHGAMRSSSRALLACNSTVRQFWKL